MFQLSLSHNINEAVYFHAHKQGIISPSIARFTYWQHIHQSRAKALGYPILLHKEEY